MRLLKILSLCMLLLPASAAWAQGVQVQDPTTWTYEVKRKGANEYQLVFHLKLKDKWHIWSLNPGGDGSQIPPSFTFNENESVELKGEVTERGKPITQEIEGIDGKVTYYPGLVAYEQTVIVTGKTTITGSLEYQVCTDNLCLPPKKKDFVFEIK